MRIGLTGGIGCGKSSVLMAFERSGFAVIQADVLGHELLDSQDTRAFVFARFGMEVFAQNGAIDRVALAGKVFSDSCARADLEAFMHPRIRAVWEGEFSRSCGGDIVVEIPLLFEKGWEGDFELCICVYASESVRLDRLERRGLPREQALSRIAAQMPLSEKKRRADIVFFNDGSKEFLEMQVEEFLQKRRIPAAYRAWNKFNKK